MNTLIHPSSIDAITYKQTNEEVIKEDIIIISIKIMKILGSIGLSDLKNRDDKLSDLSLV